MKRFTRVPVAFLLSVALSGCRGASGVDGAWKPAEAELAGQAFPEAVLASMSLTIRQRDYVVLVGGQPDKGTLQFHDRAKPAALDITGTDGPNKGKTFLAIYERNGDTLRICYDLSGKQRPTEFRTAKETQQFLVTYVRAKD